MRNTLLLSIALFSFSASAEQPQVVNVLPLQMIGMFQSADVCNDTLYTRLFRSKEEMTSKGFKVAEPVLALPYVGYVVYTKNSKDTILTVYCADAIMFASIETQQ